MNQRSPRRLPPLPPHVDPHDPRTLAWRLDHLEERVWDLEGRPGAIERLERLPWERVVLPLALLLAWKMGWISGDIVSSLLGR
jgi:hypothetical protein